MPPQQCMIAKISLQLNLKRRAKSELSNAEMKCCNAQNFFMSQRLPHIHCFLIYRANIYHRCCSTDIFLYSQIYLCTSRVCLNRLKSDHLLFQLLSKHRFELSVSSEMFSQLLSQHYTHLPWLWTRSRTLPPPPTNTHTHTRSNWLWKSLGLGY